MDKDSKEIKDVQDNKNNQDNDVLELAYTFLKSGAFIFGGVLMFFAGKSIATGNLLGILLIPIGFMLWNVAKNLNKTNSKK